WTGVGGATWGLLRPPVTPLRALAALAVVPSCWLVADWARSWQGFGGPWAVYGASQWQHPVFLALAALGGVWLVSFALVAANTGILVAAVARRIPVRLVGAGAAAVAIGAGPVAYALTSAAPVGRHVTVAMVQTGVVRSPAVRVNASQRLSAGLARDHADLIVWGESSIAYDLNLPKYGWLLHQLEALSAADHAPILLNQDSIAPDGDKSKVAVLLSSTGVDARYVKTRLVPFGEYIPFRQQLGWLTKISKAAPQNMIAGTGAHVMQVTPPASPSPSSGRPLTIGVLICFESAFPDMSRVDTDQGAQLIVYQTSDSTWQAGWEEWVLAQHAALGALRAAETGRPVMQAALTGDSVAFDPRGRLLAWQGPSFRGATVVRLALPSASSRTLYDRLGDYVPWIAVAIVVLAAAIALIRTGRLRIRTACPTGIALDGNVRGDRSGVATGPAREGPEWHGTVRDGTMPDGTASGGSDSGDGRPAAAPRTEQ
ncbi:MAG TPA: apolipoprotein N-acyltransferase, partial [Streptosporangiaceae bacterium]|nr:apolipoprotein N-acyltransferase [Streptosporangiaceae bacterium]